MHKILNKFKLVKKKKAKLTRKFEATDKLRALRNKRKVKVPGKTNPRRVA